MSGWAVLERELETTRRERGVVEVRRTLWRVTDPHRGERHMVMITVRALRGHAAETTLYHATADGTVAHPATVARWSAEIDHTKAIRRAGYLEAPARASV